MYLEDLKPGLRVRITPDHPYAGRIGHIVKVGIFDLLHGGECTGAKIDIGEGGLIIVSSKHLEVVDPNPLPPGWSEFEV